VRGPDVGVSALGQLGVQLVDQGAESREEQLGQGDAGLLDAARDRPVAFYLPSAVAMMATAPQVLYGFLKIRVIFETTTLDPLAREVLVMTVATRNGCRSCVANHTAKLAKLEADPEIVEALREQRPLADERLEAIRVFTSDVLATAGG
jgi:AhpD family alkylhydroperoxidase